MYCMLQQQYRNYKLIKRPASLKKKRCSGRTLRHKSCLNIGIKQVVVGLSARCFASLVVTKLNENVWEVHAECLVQTQFSDLAEIPEKDESNMKPGHLLGKKNKFDLKQPVVKMHFYHSLSIVTLDSAVGILSGFPLSKLMTLGGLHWLFYVRSHKAKDCWDKEEEQWKTVFLTAHILTVTIQTGFCKECEKPEDEQRHKKYFEQMKKSYANRKTKQIVITV